MTTMQQASRAAGPDGVPFDWQEGDAILDLYDVRRLLGRGGMGSVFLVHHRRWGIDLAVKAPRLTMASKASGIEAFERECETWVNLGEHPNIVKCYYVRRLGGIPRVFAEYVRGGNLGEAILSGRLYRGGKDVALGRILDMAIQLARGLAYAQGKGLVHRDVKPANVMLTLDGTAKVTDFGIAAMIAHDGAHVTEGAMTGTPLYASPEQSAGRNVTRQTDLWSYGMSVLEMFIGGVTWMAGPAAPDVLEGYLEQGPESLDIPQAPDKVAALLRQCFCLHPEDRPRDFGEVERILVEAHRECCGTPYARETPRAIEESPDVLCNRAMSYLDLGRTADAESLWQEAIKAQPDHAETLYNQGLYLWRAGRITDRDLVAALSKLCEGRPGEWLPLYLLAEAHLERGDAVSAQACLDRIPSDCGEDNDLRELARAIATQMTNSRGRIKNFWGHNSAVSAVYLGWDASVALSGSVNGAVRLWDMATLTERFALTGHKAFISSVVLSADGRYVLSASADASARVWDALTGEGIRTYQGHAGPVTAAALTGDGRCVLTASMDGSIRVWEMATGVCEWVLQGHAGGVRSLFVAEFGRYALSGGMDGNVNVWDIGSGDCQASMAGHSGPVLVVSLRRDGRYALSAGEDATLRLWEVGTGRCLHVFEGHRTRVTSLCMERNGAYALSADEAKTMMLWEVNTGRCLHTFQGQGPLSLSGNGQFALTGDQDGKLHLWSVACGAPPVAARMMLCRTGAE